MTTGQRLTAAVRSLGQEPDPRLVQLATEDREPYVGTGADGARRSAEIDRAELDTLPTPSQPGYEDVVERRSRLQQSVIAWEAQAERLSGGRS